MLAITPSSTARENREKIENPTQASASGTGNKILKLVFGVFAAAAFFRFVNILASSRPSEDFYQTLAWDCQFGLGNQFEVILDSQCPVSLLAPGVLEQIEAGMRDVNERSPEQKLTPLGCASIGTCQVDAITALSRKGANPNIGDRDFSYPLHHALRDSTNEECSLALLKIRDIEVEVLDQNALTFLQHAALHNRVETAKAMIEKGVSINTWTYHSARKIGNTARRLSALDFALLKNHRDFARVLLENGADTTNTIDPDQVKEIQREIESNRQFYFRVQLAGGVALVALLSRVAVVLSRNKSRVEASDANASPSKRENGRAIRTVRKNSSTRKE